MSKTDEQRAREWVPAPGEIDTLVGAVRKCFWMEMANRGDEHLANLIKAIRAEVRAEERVRCIGLEAALRSAVYCIDSHYQENVGPCDCDQAGNARAFIAERVLKGEKE